jgi:hypothetical protein
MLSERKQRKLEKLLGKLTLDERLEFVFNTYRPPKKSGYIALSHEGTYKKIGISTRLDLHGPCDYYLDFIIVKNLEDAEKMSKGSCQTQNQLVILEKGLYLQRAHYSDYSGETDITALETVPFQFGDERFTHLKPIKRKPWEYATKGMVEYLLELSYPREPHKIIYGSTLCKEAILKTFDELEIKKVG